MSRAKAGDATRVSLCGDGDHRDLDGPAICRTGIPCCAEASAGVFDRVDCGRPPRIEIRRSMDDPIGRKRTAAFMSRHVAVVAMPVFRIYRFPPFSRARGE